MALTPLATTGKPGRSTAAASIPEAMWQTSMLVRGLHRLVAELVLQQEVEAAEKPSPWEMPSPTVVLEHQPERERAARQQDRPMQRLMAGLESVAGPDQVAMLSALPPGTETFLLRRGRAPVQDRAAKLLA